MLPLGIGTTELSRRLAMRKLTRDSPRPSGRPATCRGSTWLLESTQTFSEPTCAALNGLLSSMWLLCDETETRGGWVVRLLSS